MSKGVLLRCWLFSGVRDWVSCFPLAAMSVANGRAGQGPGGARPHRGGAAGVLEVTGRVPDDVAAGKREPGPCGGIFGCSGSSPWLGPLCGQCRWLQSSLRVSPAGAGAAWGGSASEEAVRRGQSRGRPRRRVAAGQTQDATSRPAAGQEELFMPAPPVRRAGRWGAATGSGSARRAGRRRSGSGAAGRRRPWRCCGLLSRGGR